MIQGKTLIIDRSTRQYQMLGCEVMANIFGAAIYPKTRDAIVAGAAEFVSQVRVECTGKRIDVGGRFDFTGVDDNLKNAVLPLADAVKRVRGERLRVNLCNVAFGSKVNPAYPHTSADNFARYGEFAVACVNHVEAAGLAVDYWEVCLEPDNKKGLTRFNSPVLFAQATKAARAALDRAGLTHVKIIAPSCVSGDTALAWLQGLATSDPAALALFDVYSYHPYTGTNATVTAQIGAFARSQGKVSAMLEYKGCPPSRIWVDLAGGASGWQRYGLAGSTALPPGDRLNGVYRVDPTTGAYVENGPTTETRAHFRTVYPGSWRVAASLPGAPVAAYEAPDGRLSAVFARPAGPMTITGTPAAPLADGAYRLWCATPSADTKPGTTLDLGTFTAARGALAFTVPVASLCTVEAIR